MLTAIAEDFADFSASVHVPIDPRFKIQVADNVVLHPIDAQQPLWPQWIAAAQGCDRSLIIAPETDGLLAQSVAMLSAAGLSLCNGYGDFLRCASDKGETARNFAVAGVPHPPTWTCSTVPLDSLPASARWVVKPRNGCGTDGVVVHPSIESAMEASRLNDLLIQPWIEGRPASIAAIVEGHETTLFPAVGQRISAEDIAYRGGFGPLDESDQQRALRLAKLAIDAFPRTPRGFIGLDLVLANDPLADCVIEVNPRLTTSYVGLRKIVEGNIAARIVGLDRSPVRCAVDVGQVSWNSAGEVWSN